MMNALYEKSVIWMEGGLPRPGLSGKWQPGAGQKPAGGWGSGGWAGRTGGPWRVGPGWDGGNPTMVAGAWWRDQYSGGPRPQWAPNKQPGRR